ncbi:MAG TPA: response regulator transcription factor [Actinobacteria bacterium]|nr:response regulator transcription factor [Actinomycetota bacterium]
MDKKKILVVDDDFNIAHLLNFKLSKEGYEVEEACDGKDALLKAASFEPDLILLDIMMPIMSGWEVNEKLRKQPKLKNIPVVMVTAVDQLKEQIKSLEAEGIKDYITKPFDFSELLKTVEMVLTKQPESNSLRARH